MNRLGPLGSLTEHISTQVAIFLMCGSLTTWAENTSAFLNSPCIDLDISICIKNRSHQEGCLVPGTTE